MAKKYRSLSGKIFNTKLEAIADNLEYYRNASYRFDVKGLNAAKNLELELPFIEDKAITLSDAGLATGARLSTNMLDSIAKYANKAGLPILTALGLAVKESTLGNPTDDKSVYELLSPEKELYFRMRGTGLHINKGDAVDARSMINYYKDVEDNPYYAAFGEVERRFPNDSFKLEAQLRAGENYADRQEAKRLSLKDKNVLLAGFEFYRDYPDKYNTLLLNYQLLVSKRGEEVWNSPEIQQWWNDYNLLKLLEKLYNNEGALVRFKAAGGEINEPMDWDKLSMRDRAAYIRNAVSRGINTPLDIRNDYNEFKGGGKKNSGNLKKIFLNSLLLSLNGYSRYNTPLWRKFLTDLALLESSYNANALNSIGAKGYFQLMPSNRSATWSNPVLLFHEMYKLSDSNMEYFRKNLTKDDIHRAESMGIDIYGLMAGAHLGGVGNAIKAIRGQGNAKDMNNSSVLGYMKKFSQTSNNTPALTDSKVMKMPPFEYTEPPVIPALLAAVIIEQPIILEPIAMGTILEKPSILQTIPEVIVTPKPRYLDDSLEILLLLSKLMTPYKTVELPKPLTATERLALINENRNTLLLKDLENNIIRNSLLGNYDNNRLRRDVEDLQFYRNMSALGGNLYATGSSLEDEELDEFGYPVGYWENSRLHKELSSLHKLTQAEIDTRNKRIAANEEAARRFNNQLGMIMSQLEDSALSTPITGGEYKEASDLLILDRMSKVEDYKKGAEAAITAAELGLSGASLLGAYANWKNWANSANVTRKTIANLLLRALLPMQVGGVAIDGYQTYDAFSNDDPFNAKYNGVSVGLGTLGSLGAADIYPNYVDRVLDVMGIIQNTGDFLKFGYDTYNSYLNSKDRKALGGNLFPKGGSMINVNPGDRVFTDLCALWSNSLLRDNGYLINGNAWNLGNVDLLYNGFEGLDRPENYDSRVITDYNHKAADNVFKNFDSKTLDTSKPYVVNMYYNDSPSLEEAYNNGKGVTGTHTGVLTFDPDTKRWWVTHNIHGNIHLEPFVSLLNGKGKYGVTAIYAPREKNMWNRVKGFFGFDNGGYINKV